MKTKAPRVMSPVRRPYAHAVEAARAFCAPLRMREPRDVDVEALAMRAGASVILPRKRTRGEGHVLRGRAEDGGIVAVREDVYGTPKGSFVVVHEIGHMLLHHQHDELPICTGASVAAPPRARKTEGEASDAGCEIVMPEAWFAPACKGPAPSMEALRALADRFRMSLTSTALRALLFVEQPCAFVLIKRGAIDWCACSEGWDVYLHRRAPVPARIDIEASRKGVTVPATAWGDGHEDALVKQFAIAARDEDVVLAWLVRDTAVRVRAGVATQQRSR